MGRLAVAAAAFAVAAALAIGVAVGMALDGGASASPPADGFVLRPSEQPGPSQGVVDAPFSFRVLGWRCGLRAVAGDHADWLPDGQYCRVRVRLENLERPVATYDTSLQELVDSAGRAYRADLNSTQISDQPTVTQVKSRAVAEFDVWFDVPAEAAIVAARFRAQAGSPAATVPLGAAGSLPS